MPRKDKYHTAVKNALVKEGWTVTNDPFRIVAGTQDVYIDLAAERLIAAERIGETGEIERIAVEVKSFLGLSSVADLEQAIGQYLLSWRHQTDGTGAHPLSGGRQTDL